MPPFVTSLLANTKALVGILVVALLVIPAIWFFASLNGTQKDMVAKENALSAQYSDNQNELHSYVMQIKEALGVANTNTQALDTVLTDVVRGRYEMGSSAKPGSGSAFSAIVEAYPDLSQMNVNYQNVQKAIFSGRDAFKNQQTKLLDMLSAYKTWKNSGFFHKMLTGMVGAPSENLTAKVNGRTLHGQDALDQMETLVLDADTNNSFETGEEQSLDTGSMQAPTSPTTATNQP